MERLHQNEVMEWRVPDGCVEVEAPGRNFIKLTPFLKGDGNFYVRYASFNPGVHVLRAGNQVKEVEVAPYVGENPLYKHGSVRMADNKRHLEHMDGTPFFWLGDTWWMGLTTRLSFPEGFSELTRDRVEKGFTVVQIIAGLYPDMDPFDPRGMNEGGYPWDEDFTQINPAYFDAADQKIAYLVEHGVVPCIVGCWGYFVDFAGTEAIRKHWDYLIARWGAYPVMWCLAGEALMPFYNNRDIQEKRITVEQYTTRMRTEWTKLTAHVKNIDPFHRLVTIHPTQNGHEQVDDEQLLDLDMLQTGHGGPMSLAPTLKQVKAAVDRKAMPVINSEVCYEGISGSSLHDVQRYLFLSNVLMGCCGHTYGANGIWQLNSRAQPYGVSPHGASWGDTPWEEAYQLPGSRHIGNCKSFLCRFEWWRFEEHPEWTARPCSYEALDGFFCAGIPGEVRVIYKPYFGGTFWGEDEMREIDGEYYAYYYDPILDKIRDLGLISPDEKGTWISPRVTAFQDWLLVLSKKPVR